MNNHLPRFIYAAIYLVIAGGVLFFYLTKKQSLFYRKWWALLGVFLLLALAGSAAYKGAHQDAVQKIPSKSELGSAINNSESVAADELLYNSPDGYQILIPKGLTYAGSQGVVSLVATNKKSPGDALTLVVMKQSSTQPLDSLVTELTLTGAKANPPMTYVFEGKGKNGDQRRGYVEGPKNGVLMKTALLFALHEKSMYRVAISTTKNNFDQHQVEIERVLGSFKIL